MTDGVAGLLRDKTRRSRIPPLEAQTEARVVAATLTDPLGETTHWTAAAMAKVHGISVSSVQRIWRRHGLQPHRTRLFKLSNDPQFASKLREIVGLYAEPPAHAVVLSIDEKSQIQALDRTQPGLPLKKGRCGTMTHDYIRKHTSACVLNRQRASSSHSSVAKKLSHMALSYASPTEPIEGRTPASRQCWPNAIEVYWEPWSE